MAQALYAATFIAALGAGLIAGAFFAFSAFVMTALGRLPPRDGIAAMQSINVVVINPVFLGAFLGTAALSAALLVAAMTGLTAAPIALAAGGLLYIAGCFVVTIMLNVPLNEKLATTAPEGSGSAALWRHYLSRWTFWNSIRTAASLAAMAAFILALR